MNWQRHPISWMCTFLVFSPLKSPLRKQGHISIINSIGKEGKGLEWFILNFILVKSCRYHFPIIFLIFGVVLPGVSSEKCEAFDQRIRKGCLVSEKEVVFLFPFFPSWKVPLWALIAALARGSPRLCCHYINKTSTKQRVCSNPAGLFP